MASGGGMNSDDIGADFFAQDIVINILLRLSSAVCIARFRCVCRAWQNLLSDPNFIRQILFFQNSDDQEKLRVLIAGRGPQWPWPLHYSLRSYETLLPIARQNPESPGCDNAPSILTAVSGYFTKVVGCCDGIFCIASDYYGDLDGGRPSDIILWNPTTSETKILPPCPVHPVRDSRRSLLRLEEHIGFGFDPRAKDYKIIRVLKFESNHKGDICDDYGQDTVDFGGPLIYHGRFPLVFTEVYSLRNDSWTTLDQSVNTRKILAGRAMNINHQRDTSRNEKCYWLRKHECTVISFDMTTEVFGFAPIPLPPGLDTKRIEKKYWRPVSCFMLKGALLTTFEGENYKDHTACEIWGLLGYGVVESWTKLFAFRPPEVKVSFFMLEVWKDGMYICYSEGAGDAGRIFSFDPATGEIIRDLQIEGDTIQWLHARTYIHAHAYTPTRLSLSIGYS